MFSGKGRHLLYLIIALSMLVYAWPYLELGGPWNAARVFGLIWTLFALLIVIANANALLLVSEEKRKELARIKRAKAMLWERRLLQKTTGTRKVRG